MGGMPDDSTGPPEVDTSLLPFTRRGTTAMPFPDGKVAMSWAISFTSA